MHFKVDWIVGCADADFPPETKLCYEYVRVHLGFYVCSPSSTGICSLGMDPAMNLPNSYTSHILSIETQNCETKVATALTKICPFWGNGGSRHLMGVHAKKRGFTQVSRCWLFRCAHCISEGFIAVLDNTCKKFDSIINCCFGCFFLV